MIRRTFLAIFMLFFVTSSIAVAAQEDEPEPGPTASQELPPADMFGPDWVQSEVVSPDALEQYGFAMSPDVFREGAAGIYLGPEGNRALVVRFLLTDNRVAIRQSWTDAVDLMDSLTLYVTEDYQRNQQLETMGPPDGCIEASRIEGAERVFRLPVGGTLCAADDDSLYLILVYGSVDALTGVAASDHVATTITQTLP